jgi:hypothetical protein
MRCNVSIIFIDGVLRVTIVLQVDRVRARGITYIGTNILGYSKVLKIYLGTIRCFKIQLLEEEEEEEEEEN